MTLQYLKKTNVSVKTLVLLTWTACGALDGVKTNSPGVLCEVMLLTMLVYQADGHMESVVQQELGAQLDLVIDLFQRMVREQQQQPSGHLSTLQRVLIHHTRIRLAEPRRGARGPRSRFVFFSSLMCASSSSSSSSSTITITVASSFDLHGHSARTDYMAEDVCRHLASMCSMYNNYTTVARNHDERSLNLVDFVNFHGKETLPNADSNVEVSKAELVRIAEHKRQGLKMAMARLEEVIDTGDRLAKELGALGCFEVAQTCDGSVWVGVRCQRLYKSYQVDSYSAAADLMFDSEIYFVPSFLPGTQHKYLQRLKLDRLKIPWLMWKCCEHRTVANRFLLGSRGPLLTICPQRMV